MFDPSEFMVIFQGTIVRADALHVMPWTQVIINLKKPQNQLWRCNATKKIARRRLKKFDKH